MTKRTCTAAPTVAETDRQIELDLHRMILQQVAAQTGPRISLTVDELARVIDASHRDVLNKTADLAALWWIDGRRFASYGDIREALERDIWDDLSCVELEFYRDDCGARLVAALMEGGGE